ncbi:MAG: preprotein translocase subunit YajC [Egibacteraceae bacterium]
MDLPLSILAQQPAPGGGLLQLVPFLLIAVVFYLLILRPQRTRAKQQKTLIDSLGNGDRIVTIGGLHGTIQSVDDQTMRLEVAPGVVVTFSKQAVARRLVDIDDEDFEQAGSD